ncbi:MAG: enoyl-CoA hydratase/isomerase family protein [Acidimicrobiia bacterium]
MTDLADLALTTVRVERADSIVHVVLNRPDRLNAQTPRMWRELADLGRVLVDDNAIRVVVVRGEGRAFSSGLDTSVFADGLFDAPEFANAPDRGARDPDPFIDSVLRAQDAFSWLETAPFVTIAALHGYALGAGLQIALACDLRVATRSLQCGLLEFRYGILPDLGATQRLPQLVGLGKAKELILTAATIDGEEAYRIGLVEQLVADDALDSSVVALAERCAAQPPIAVRGTKQALHAAGRVPIDAGLRIEAEGQRACMNSADMREALSAYVEQRAPRFTGH